MTDEEAKKVSFLPFHAINDYDSTNTGLKLCVMC